MNAALNKNAALLASMTAAYSAVMALSARGIDVQRVVAGVNTPIIAVAYSEACETIENAMRVTGCTGSYRSDYMVAPYHGVYVRWGVPS